MADNLIIFGAGGHADSCKEVFEEFGPWNYIFLKRDEFTYREGHCFIAVGENKKRYDIWLENQGYTYHSFLSSKAMGFPVKFGKGSIVMPGAIIRTGVEIGDFTIINSGAILEHGVKVGSFCHLAPGVVALGDGRIADGAFIGSNSTLCPGTRVGTWQFVKANSLVKESLSDQDIRSRHQD
jgi:acetyltransferase-like isoleucine patch superfamily enzyme